VERRKFLLDEEDGEGSARHHTCQWPCHPTTLRFIRNRSTAVKIQSRPESAYYVILWGDSSSQSLGPVKRSAPAANSRVRHPPTAAPLSEGIYR